MAMPVGAALFRLRIGDLVPRHRFQTDQSEIVAALVNAAAQRLE
jgi:hypothetical protein